MKVIEIPKKFAKDLEEELDNLIQVIDHDTDSIDDDTTRQARALLQKLSNFISKGESSLNE